MITPEGFTFPTPPGIEIEDFYRFCSPFSSIKLKENDYHVRLVCWRGNIQELIESSVVLKFNINDSGSSSSKNCFYIRVPINIKDSFFIFLFRC
jgi:hypothetical protein